MVKRANEGKPTGLSPDKKVAGSKGGKGGEESEDAAMSELPQFPTHIEMGGGTERIMQMMAAMQKTIMSEIGEVKDKIGALEQVKEKLVEVQQGMEGLAERVAALEKEREKEKEKEKEREGRREYKGAAGGGKAGAGPTERGYEVSKAG
eukprot:16428336-Heterocapsa_arctica.AAC.1